MTDMLWAPLFYTLLGGISFTGGHQLTSEEKHTIVELHNHFRSQVMPTAANMRNMVVWADTATIGCASHTCNGVKGISVSHAVILVCNYFPGGNYEDEHPYQEGKPCTQCPDKIQKCKNNLCVAYTDEDESTTEVDPSTESPVTEVAETRIYLDRQQTPYVAYTDEDESTTEVNPSTESPATEVAETRIYLDRQQTSYGVGMTTAWSAVLVTTLLSFVLCLDSAT